MLTDILIIAGVALVGWMANFFLGGGARARQMRKRVSAIKKHKTLHASTTQDLSLRRKSNDPKGIAYLITKPLPNFTRLGEQFERAGIVISPKQYVFKRLLSVVLIMGIFALLHQSVVLGFSLAIIFGVWVPLKLLKRKINKQTRAFLKLFPDAIDLIVRGLRSGLPVSESIVMVSREVGEPVRSVFANIHHKMKLGVSLEKALQETARRLDMTEFNFFTTSIVLQRETGGNLAEILNNLSEVLRGRFMMRMKIKAMSSEARASSYIIGALPFVVMGAVTVMTPDYMTVLITDPRGNVCAAIAAGMMISGMWVMNRMTKFEI